MNDFDSFSVKPDNILTSSDIASMFNLSRGQVSRYARILKFQKDSTNIYLFDEGMLKKFKEFLQVIGHSY